MEIIHLGEADLISDNKKKLNLPQSPWHTKGCKHSLESLIPGPPSQALGWQLRFVKPVISKAGFQAVMRLSILLACEKTSQRTSYCTLNKCAVTQQEAILFYSILEAFLLYSSSVTIRIDFKCTYCKREKKNRTKRIPSLTNILRNLFFFFWHKLLKATEELR